MAVYDRLTPPPDSMAAFGWVTGPGGNWRWTTEGWEWLPSPESVAIATTQAAQMADVEAAHRFMAAEGALVARSRGTVAEDTAQALLAAGARPEFAQAMSDVIRRDQAAQEKDEGFFRGMISSGTEFAKEVGKLAVAGAATYFGAQALGAALGGGASSAVAAAKGAAASTVSGAEAVLATLAAPATAIKEVFTEGNMSISSMIRDAAKQGLQSFVGGLFGGDGAGVGPVIADSGGYFGGGGYSGLPAAMPVMWPSMAGIASNLPSVGGLIRGGAAAAGGMVMAGGRALVSALTKKKAVSLAKVLGIQGAATALGIGAVELAQWVIDDTQRKRRGKGVTAAQLRTTRRTMRTVERMHKQIAGYCRDAQMPRRVTYSAPRVGKRCR